MIDRFIRRALALAGLAAMLAVPCTAGAADFSASGLTCSGSTQQLGPAASYGSETVTRQMPGENAVSDGVNPITGQPYAGAYQPILVTVDTHPNALPHWGVSSADLIYELPIQADGSTRSLAVFMGDIPESAGPVRSARVPMCSLREMWGGVYCFYGMQEGRDTNNVRNWVKAYSDGRKLAYPAYLNGMTKNSSWFPRSSDANHVAPYNVRMDIGAVKADYQLSPAAHPFLFGDGLSADRGEAVNGLVISYKQTSPAYVTAYQYNASTGLYDRYRNGTPYVDANNGAACAYANVIVMRTDIRWNSGNPSRPVIRLHGEGVAEIFQNGRYIRGTWARASSDTQNLNSRIVYFDENGQELTMKPGKTFIQIVDNEQPVVVLADQAIAGAVEPQEQRLTIGSGSVKSSLRSEPKATRTPKATATPTATPTAAPTATPTATPTTAPTATPTPDPTPSPTPEPTAESTAEPTAEPTPDPTPEATEPAPGGDGETGGETGGEPGGETGGDSGEQTGGDSGSVATPGEA